MDRHTHKRKTLVVLLAEARAHDITFKNFKQHVLDELDADLCVCIGAKSDFDYDNPFYTLAKHRFLYDEPEDFGDAFDYAFSEIQKDKYERFSGTNALYGKLRSPSHSTENITGYGRFDNPYDFDFDSVDDDEIVYHEPDFPNDTWRKHLFGIKKSNHGNSVKQERVTTFKKGLPWREFLKIKGQILGGVKDHEHQHPGSAGILIFFRWFLLKSLKESNLISEYDRFIITRSDFVFQLPHPNLELLSDKYIWIPNGEHYAGYTDRHVVLSKHNIEQYLNIFNCLVTRSNDYFFKMRNKTGWNLEQLIRFHLMQNRVLHLVREFPYVMYTVRGKHGTTRWAGGVWSAQHRCYIKYPSELAVSTYFKELFLESGLDISQFYKEMIQH